MADLAGMSVVVTRAAHQADELCELIEKAGGEAIRFPVTKIEPVDDHDAALAPGLDQLDQVDIAIFVSPNAATYGLSMLARLGRHLPENASVLAVGPGTARQLVARGVKVSAVPKGKYDSETLLALPDLEQVAGRSVLIIRGFAGRELLADALTQRGARVSHLPCYRRIPLDQVDANILGRWGDSGFDALILTSVSATDHLWSMLGTKITQLIENMTIVVSSRRIGEHCRSLGFAGSVVVADNAGMPSLVKALKQEHRAQSGADTDTREVSVTSNRDPSKTPSTQQPGAGAAVPETEKESQTTAAIPVIPTPPRDNGKAGWVASLALVIAILGAGVSIYTWYVTQVAGQLEVGRDLGRLDGMSREVDRLVDSQSELQAKVDTALSRSLEDKRELLEKLDAVQAALHARLKALADEQAGAIAQQDDEISSLAGVVAATRSQIGAVHEDWLLREGAHLLLLANQRLTLLGDIDLAKRALTLADDRLRAFADPGILEVRRTLSQELSALDQLDSTDLSGTALALGSLVQTVAALPLKGDGDRPDWTTTKDKDDSAGDAASSSAAAAEEPGFFSTLMVRISDDLGSLVRVRRVDETELPKLDNSERFLAYENLRLHLLVAQLALLRSDQPLYQENLAEARSWLSGYFEPSSATQRFDAQLSEVMQVQVAQDIPDISASLTLLRSEIRRRDQAE